MLVPAFRYKGRLSGLRAFAAGYAPSAYAVDATGLLVWRGRPIVGTCYSQQFTYYA